MIKVCFEGPGLMAVCRALEAETSHTVEALSADKGEASHANVVYVNGLMSALESVRDACRDYPALNSDEVLQ